MRLHPITPIQVVMGDRYSFAVEHEAPSMLYMFSGNLAILAWKSGNMLIKVGTVGWNTENNNFVFQEIKYITEDDEAKKKKKGVMSRRRKF